MKYMVKECHPGYAVVLSEDGRFLKVANMHYEIGQTVTNVIEMQIPSAQKSSSNKKRSIYAFTTIASLAACLVLIFTLMFRTNQTPYASVYVTINPEVRIDVNQKDVVIGLEGMNEDGRDLIDGYFYHRKSLELVLDELTDRAIELGYLHEGGRITLTLDSENNEWVVTHSDTLTNHLDDYLQEKLTITIEVTDTVSENQQIIIPVDPTDDTYSESDYGETAPSETHPSEIIPSEPPATNESSESTPPNTSVNTSDDSNYDDGATDYGQNNYDSDNGDSSYGNSNDDDSNYDDSDNDD